MALPNPITRKEQYLNKAATGSGSAPPEPVTREEMYLAEIAKGGGGGSVTVDAALSATSENPVQNKLIYAALNEKIGKDDEAVTVTMTASGNTVTCFKDFFTIYTLFAFQLKTYFALVKSKTDYQVFDVARVDAGNAAIYLSSIVSGVLSQIVLTPGGTNTMTGTLTTIDLNLQNASGASF